MLRVTVELLPGGREQDRRTLAVAEIANVAGGRMADYEVRTTTDVGAVGTAVLRNYPRWAAPVWDLVARAIAKVLTGREQLPRRPKALQIPIRECGAIRFVRLAEIPEPARTAFAANIAHSTCPIVDAEPDPHGCAYAWDWRDFLDGVR